MALGVRVEPAGQLTSSSHGTHAESGWLTGRVCGDPEKDQGCRPFLPGVFARIRRGRSAASACVVRLTSPRPASRPQVRLRHGALGRPVFGVLHQPGSDGSLT